MKDKLVKIGGKEVITFKQKTIYLDEFNIIAIKHWRKSRFKHVEEVTFCLQNVEFIFPMQACQLFSWIEELLKLNKKVHLMLAETLERKSQLFSFLYRHSFFLKIDAYDNFICDRLEYSKIPPHLTKPFSEYSINFSAFEDLESFNRFLGKQSGANDTSNNVTLRVNSHYLDQKRNLTDIAITEMGKNVFDHNKNSPAYLVVTEQNKNHLKNLKNLPSFMADYINAAEDDDFLEVAITDLGDGICHTLKDDFNLNPNVLQTFNNTNNKENILQYAFWRESSSKDRNKDERIFDDDEMPDLVMPSGLFFCKELVEATNGLMIVQCNGVLCTYVYDKTKLKYINKDKWQLKSSPLDIGTSISILIPKKVKQYEMIPFHITKDKITIKNVLGILSWQYSIDDEKTDLDNVKHFTKKIVSEVEQKLSQEASGTLIIDLSNYGSQSKYLYKIICYCMYFVKSPLAILLANLPEKMLQKSALRGLFQQARTTEFFDKIYWYSENFTGAIHSDGSVKDVSFDKTQIEEQIMGFNKAYLHEQIKASKNLNAKAFIPKPSNHFIQGYYELSKVIEEPNFCFSAVDLFSSQIEPFDFIIITTKILSFIAKTMLKKWTISTSNVMLITSDDMMAKPILYVSNKGFKNALILTDVVASGQTLDRITKELATIKCGYQSIAFVSNKIVTNIDYSLIVEKFLIYKQKPASWRLAEIHEVNTENNSLIRVNEPSKQLATLDVFEKWADQMQSVYIGHIKHESMCYLTYFDTLKIVQHSDLYFVSQIVKQISSILKKTTNPRPKIVLLHASRNEEAKLICDHVHQKVNDVKIQIMSFNKYKAPTKEIITNNANEHIVFFVDTAITTATTFKFALEWAAINECQEFHSYIFIDRTNGGDFELIEGIEKYKNVVVEHNPIYRVHAPAFSSNCPVCHLKKELTKCNEFLPDGTLKSTIERWTNLLDFDSPESCLTRPAETKVVGKALYTRHLIELCSLQKSNLNLIEETKNLIITLGQNCSLLESFIEIFWLETYAFTNSKSNSSSINYHGQLNDEIKKAIYCVVLSKMQSDDLKPLIFEKGLWLLASLSFSRLLDKFETISKTMSQKLKVYNTFGVICCWLTKPEMILEVEKKLHMVFHLSDNSNTEAYISIRNTLLETIAYLGLKKQTTQISNSFNEALYKLRILFEEENRPHTNACELYTKRVNPTNNVNNLLVTDKWHNKMVCTFEETFNHLETILTATRCNDIKYSYLTKSTYKSDFKKIHLELERMTSLAKQNQITTEDVLDIRERFIQELSQRFIKHFVYKESSLVWALVESCKCDVIELIHNLQMEIKKLYEAKEITFNFDNCYKEAVTSIPINPLSDILNTIIDNTYKYSDKNSTVLANIKRQHNFFLFTVESVSTQNTIHLVNGHGLANAKKILSQFSANIKVENKNHKNIIFCELPYLEA